MQGGRQRRRGPSLLAEDGVEVQRGRGAEDEEAVPDLEDGAVPELESLHPSAADEGAVARAGVLEQPAAEDALQRGVRGGEEAIRDLDAQLSLAGAVGARGGGHPVAPAQPYGVDAGEQRPQRPRERRLGLERQRQAGRVIAVEKKWPGLVGGDVGRRAGWSLHGAEYPPPPEGGATGGATAADL